MDEKLWRKQKSKNKVKVEDRRDARKQADEWWREHEAHLPCL
jgi:hypothetical protein